MNKITGMTLVEMLLALLITVLIVLVLTSIYSITQKSDLSQTAWITIDENMHIADHLLSTVIHEAGYQGCLKSKKIAISRYEGPDIKENTDGISIEYTGSDIGCLTKDMKEKQMLYTSNTFQFKKNDFLIVSDCESMEKIRVEQMYIKGNDQIIITQMPLSKLYKAFSEISHYKKESYYISKTDRIDNHHESIYALYVRSSNTKKSELIERINDMKITYNLIKSGQMTECSGIDISDESKIAGVSIHLTHASRNHVIPDTQQYIYAALR